jgi:hypothetical protein
MPDYILIIRDGEIRLRAPACTQADGTLWSQGHPLLNASAASAAGDRGAITAAYKAKNFSAIPSECLVRVGENSGGLLAVWEREWARHPARLARVAAEESAARIEEARLEALCPGLARLRAAREAEEQYRAEFSEMMEDEDNDGVRPPARVRESAADVARECPAAAAYILAENFSRGANYAKSGAGKRALARLLAGEPHEQVISAMEAEWSAAAERAVASA